MKDISMRRAAWPSTSCVIPKHMVATKHQETEDLDFAGVRRDPDLSSMTYPWNPYDHL
jgi:hypothetical protein